MEKLSTPEDFIRVYTKYADGDFDSRDESTLGFIFTSSGFLEKLYKLAKPLKLDCYLTVDFDERLFEGEEWFDGWSWDEDGSYANTNCFIVEPYMKKDSPESYDPKWFEGKSGEEVREALADRHGVARWRVDEIINVWEEYRPLYKEWGIGRAGVDK